MSAEKPFKTTQLNTIHSNMGDMHQVSLSPSNAIMRSDSDGKTNELLIDSPSTLFCPECLLAKTKNCTGEDGGNKPVLTLEKRMDKAEINEYLAANAACKPELIGS